jgi:hypothetical protein
MRMGEGMTRGIGWIAVGGLVLLALGTAPAQAQDANVHRAIPSAVSPPASFESAVRRGWRSEDGSPGHSYWQQSGSYEITAKLDPETAKLEGTVQILYAHDAPANLNTVWLHLHQNLHKEGSPRYEAQEITGGITITGLAADGEELEERPLAMGSGYRVDGTLMEVRPTIRLEPGDTLQLDISWEMTVPQNGAGRMGHSDKEVYLMAYWFPKMAVFGNANGWNAQPYLGNAEFFDEFADYDVEISVPTGWTVMATGSLENPSDVFSPITEERLTAAATSDEKVTIADAASREAGTVTREGVDGWLSYRFTATNVRDFTWTTSNVQRWDATSALVADRDESGEEDRVAIYSFWREDRAPLWAEQWLYAKQSIEHHSEYTGLAYPWPHMTSVEGTDIIQGGMEYPMMTLISDYAGGQPADVFNVTSHEIGHMWVPMIVGTDEKRHAWMDEGSTTYLGNESRMELWPGLDHHRVEARLYLQVAAASLEESMMTHADYYEPGPSYGTASYPKPATLMKALQEVMGREPWEEAYRTFLAEWAWKYPTPWDFFNTFERVAEADLDWFWTSYYYETWTLDQSVRDVAPKVGGGSVVIIEDLGTAFFPTKIRVRMSNGTEMEHEVPVEYWLEGHTTYELEIDRASGSVARVEVDPSGYAPDIDRANNFWPRG